MKRAVVLLSGGIDSAVALAATVEAQWAAYALSVDYGQQARSELDAAEEIARGLGAEVQQCVRVELNKLSRSPLLGFGEVPSNRPPEVAQRRTLNVIVGARNAIMLSLAAGWASDVGATRVVMGATKDDQFGFPDCRQGFLSAMSEALSLGLADDTALEVMSPLAELAKWEVVRLGRALGVPLEATVSCYREPGCSPCGSCDGCVLRQQALERSIDR